MANKIQPNPCFPFFSFSQTTNFLPAQHIMPSFAQAVPYLIASFAMTSSITITNTVAGTNDVKFTTHRETRKTSKKNEAPPRGCTYHNFVGSSKYENCQNIETEIKIECGDEDAEESTRMCNVTEHPWHDEQKEEDTEAAAAADECVVHGSFDPSTHITTDSATGSCHLKFLPLFNSCDVDVDANGSPSDVFGMKAEIRNGRNTDHEDNSGLLLRFSHTGGTLYYNDDDPRETVPLHDVFPAERKLEEDYTTCRNKPKPCEKYQGRSTTPGTPTHTCYEKLLVNFGEQKNCWSKDSLHNDVWRHCWPESWGYKIIHHGASPKSTDCGCSCGCFHCFQNAELYCGNHEGL